MRLNRVINENMNWSLLKCQFRMKVQSIEQTAKTNQNIASRKAQRETMPSADSSFIIQLVASKWFSRQLRIRSSLIEAKIKSYLLQ